MDRGAPVMRATFRRGRRIRRDESAPYVGAHTIGGAINPRATAVVVVLFFLTLLV